MAANITTKLDTRRKIIEAFWELYRASSIEKITVKKITDACGIYRTTFYLHFSDIYAILESIEEGLLEELRTLQSEGSAEERMDQVYAVLKKEYDCLRILLDGRHDPAFSEAYQAELIRQVCAIQGYRIEEMDEQKRRIFRRTMSFFMDVLFVWEENSEDSFDAAIEILDGYMQKGVLRTIGLCAKSTAD